MTLAFFQGRRQNGDSNPPDVVHQPLQHSGGQHGRLFLERFEPGSAAAAATATGQPAGGCRLIGELDHIFWQDQGVVKHIPVGQQGGEALAEVWLWVRYVSLLNAVVLLVGKEP